MNSLLRSLTISAVCTLALVAGCTSTRTNIDPAYVGRWATPAGEQFSIQSDDTLGNVIVAQRPDGSTVTCGQVLNVDGKTVAQIRILDLTPTTNQTEDLNLYSFGVLEKGGDILMHRPIRPEWFALHARQHNLRYIRTDTAKPGTGVAIASSRADLESVLRAALADPTALAPAERFTRINK